MTRAVPAKIISYLGVPVFVLSIWIIHDLLKKYHLRDIANHIHDYSGLVIGTAIALTIGSYILLTFYDILALRYIKRTLDTKSTMLTSFISYVFSNNIGLSVLGTSAAGDNGSTRKSRSNCAAYFEFCRIFCRKRFVMVRRTPGE